ncbi:viral fusion peptide [Orf virus]|uniref:Viral fusion peptide n=1 Tax=Orf virus TaxID=10258 RepID=A0A3G2KP72_ORFV|nr:viral fusion peptide [Orf virus]QLI57742.1 viral fusion peptide [Orf virus]WIF30463.1 viral fusion peptide [Orf virus]
MEEGDGENLLGPTTDDPTNEDNGVYAAGAPTKESVEERLLALLDSYKNITECCRETGNRLDRLERHLESLRKALLDLNRKIDVQTGYGRY